MFRTGDIVAFRFRIVRYLAKGGMGELYEAEDLELRERIALKTILSHIAADERSILLFKREVHLARQVTHANVCRIYDVFRHRYAAAGDRLAGEVVVLAMELLHGETLADKLRRDGRLSSAEILPVVRQMAAGLTAAHRVGVVHRDFKSHNVMLVKPTREAEEMRAVVTDFGLARRSTQDESTSLSMSLSAENEISGTPAYMAPEQVEGGPVTPATDVYALGVVLYEMVTGALPFMGETPVKTAIKRLHEPPPSPRVHVADVDPLWETTILRCLALRPHERFASAGEVVSALEGGRLEPAVAPDRRQRWTGAVWSALALIVLATLVVRLCRVRALHSFKRGDYVDRGLTAEEQRQRLRAGLPLRWHQRGAHQSPVATARAESRRQQFLVPLQRPERGSAGGRPRVGCDGHPGRQGLATRRQPLDQRRADRRPRPDAGVGRAIRQQGSGPVSSVGGHLSRRCREAACPPGRGPAAAVPGRTSMRNPEAYELLLKGHFHRAKGGTEDRQKAGDYFARAIAADPSYALAHADLSDIYRSLVSSGLLDRNEYLPKARAAAQKALELDDGLADGHYALANLMTYAWEWADAEREYKRAIELNPNLALAHRWYAAYLRLMGRHEQAIAEISRARELDPLSPGVNATVGYVLSSARRYDQAITALNKTIDLDRKYPYALPLPRSHVCRTGQVHGGRCGVYEDDRARSRYACHADLSGCGVRACGRSHACAGDPPAVAIEQGVRVRQRSWRSC